MTDTATPILAAARRAPITPPADVEANRFTEAALERHKREGLELAVRARWVALAVVAALLPFLNGSWEVLYYHAGLAALALNGWAQRRVGRVGRSGAELILLALDLVIMTFMFLVPNPFAGTDWPTAMNYRFDNFIYFFIILASGTLAYSWRTILSIGTWTGLLWMIGAGLVVWLGTTDARLGQAARAAFGQDPDMLDFLDPNTIVFDLRLQEVVVFMIVAGILALTVRRFNTLLTGNAALERERENLSRYFSPNVVAQLSQNDAALKGTRTHDVGVLFVDIVGFTEYAQDRHPEEVIGTLRGFHARMEEAVFAHDGTLDKYLGDGLMATFGTPAAGVRDATNALACARAMVDAVAQFNADRAAAGEPRVTVSIGLDYGPAVLGDIGVNRLEFAVIGNTVNVASRIEKMTRDLQARIAISDHVRQQVVRESGDAAGPLDGFDSVGARPVRGLDAPLQVWALR